VNLSGYRWMWVIAMFDLPVATAADRKRYAQFRKRLIKDGFAMMQFSVYIRNASSRENADVHVSRVESAVPENGEVRVMLVTDKQFARMRVFWGKTRKRPEAIPAQLGLF
jgi:CRISPR-associated protein Cas2